MNGQEFPTPCSTDDGEPGVGSMDNCGMADAIKDGFAHLTMFSQDVSTQAIPTRLDSQGCF